MLGGGTVFRIALGRYDFIHLGEAERVAAAMHDSFRSSPMHTKIPVRLGGNRSGFPQRHEAIGKIDSPF